MFGVERLEAIRKILLRDRRIYIAGLSQTLDVSEPTIRRDLEKLEKEGFIIKTPGGAILNHISNEEKLKLDNMSPEEKEILKIATSLIEDNDIIYLGNGELCVKLVTCLDDKKGLVIVTNNLKVVNQVYKNQNLKLIVIGGELDLSDGMVRGDDVCEFMKKIIIQKSFFSVQGIDFQYGYTVNNKDDVRLIKCLKEFSKDIILLASDDNFEKVGLYNVCDINAIGSVIASKKIPDFYKQYYFENDIELYTGYNL